MAFGFEINKFGDAVVSTDLDVCNKRGLAFGVLVASVNSTLSIRQPNVKGPRRNYIPYPPVSSSYVSKNVWYL